MIVGDGHRALTLCLRILAIGKSVKKYLGACARSALLTKLSAMSEKTAPHTSGVK